MKNSPFYKIIGVALVCLLSSTYTGCKKDANTKTRNGIILNFGNPAADGCGWVIRIDNVDYKAENLDPSFEQDSLLVKVDYSILQSGYQCGLAANIGFSYIHLNSIKKR